MIRFPLRRILLVATALGAVLLVAAAGAAAAVTPAGAPAIAAAIASPSLTVTSASFVSVTGGTPNGISTSVLGGFPTDGASFGILTTGNVSSVPNTALFANTNNSGGNVRGDTDFDVTVLRTNIDVPTGANCLTFDFKFYSEEYPGFVGTAFNDAFIAELDTTTWSTSGSAITAPDNFAFDAANNVVSINSTGLGGMSAAAGAGTAFNGTQSYAANGFGPPGNAGGATGLLHASTQITAGAHSVYFSLFDQGDRLLDSAVFLDNLVAGFVPDPAANCKPGATPVNFKLSLTPASGTNPAGTPHEVTATLTDTDGAPIAGETIAFTVAGANSDGGSATTNAAGQASFTYTGLNAGLDNIAACYDADATSPCEAVASATKLWTPRADLSVVKGGTANAVVGGQITYTLTVRNNGPSPATNVTVSDPVPANTTLASATPTQGGCDTTVVCGLGGLASGATAVVTVVLNATTVGTVTNVATVSGTEPDHEPSNNSSTATTSVFGFAPGGGAFVVGDGSATGTVTFWGAQWSRVNTLSGGAAPAAFKGFALAPAVPACGTGWSTDPGNSAPPPAGPLPPFMAVIVTSSAEKSGSQISGTTAHIVIVATAPGYDANPGHAGTGTVVATIC